MTVYVGGMCGGCGADWTLNKKTLTVKYPSGKIEAWESSGLILWECPECGYADSEEIEDVL